MTKFELSVVDHLFTIAQKIEPCPDLRTRVVSAVTLKRDIVAFGFNSKKTHPMQKKYRRNKHSIYCHAEIDAIVRATKTVSIEDFKRSKIFVARAILPPKLNSKHHQYGLAKPCAGCGAAIADLGFKSVIYTHGGFECAELTKAQLQQEHKNSQSLLRESFALDS